MGILGNMSMILRLLVCGLILSGWLCSFLVGLFVGRTYRACERIAQNAMKGTAERDTAPHTEPAILRECERVAAAYARSIDFK